MTCSQFMEIDAGDRVPTAAEVSAAIKHVIVCRDCMAYYRERTRPRTLTNEVMLKVEKWLTDPECPDILADARLMIAKRDEE